MIGLSSTGVTTAPNNLPRELTSFVGREREIAQVSELLDHTALLTLTGVADAGHERLGARLSFFTRRDHDRAMELAHSRIDAASFTTAWNEGRGMTVQEAHHVQNILDKLDFHSRTQIAGWAVDRGLTGDSPP